MDDDSRNRFGLGAGLYGLEDAEGSTEPQEGAAPVEDVFDDAGRLVRGLADEDVKSNLDYMGLRAGSTSERGVLSGRTARLLDYWASRLPAEIMRHTHRRAMIAGSSVFSTTLNTVNDLTIFQVPARHSFIMLNLRQVWLKAQCVSDDEDAYTALGDYHAAYGKVGFEILFDGTSPMDAQEQLLVPDIATGALGTLDVRGYTTLNRNLLRMGENPIALYAKDKTKITGRWQTYSSDIDFVPTAVLVEVEGYTMPTKTFNEILLRIRRS
jgi:hypothetical protein